MAMANANKKELKELEKWLEEEAEYLVEHVDSLVTYYTTETARRAKLNCPVDTGYLRRSIKYKFYKNGDFVTGEVYVGAEYGIFVEFGTVYRNGTLFLSNAFTENANKFYDELLETFTKAQSI